MPVAEDYSVSSLLASLAQNGVRRTCTKSRKPPIPSRLLQELAELSDPPVAREFVAAYPLSPSHLLETLAETVTDPAVLAHLATNPRTPPHLIGELAAHPEPEVRAQVATHPQLASRKLVALATDPVIAVRCAAATSSALRLPQHALLLTDEEPRVRLQLVQHSTLPAEAALVLAADASALVRTATVAHATASEELLLGWAASDEEAIQLALATRPELPAKARQLLGLSTFPRVRRAARYQVTPQPFELLYLIEQGDDEERAWVAARPDLPATLQRELAQDRADEVRLALAGNPQLTSDVADYFATQGNETLCTVLAQNPALSADHHQVLAATRLPGVLTALAYQEDLDPDLVTFLLERSPEFLRHWALQDRPATIDDLEVARSFATDPLPTVRRFAVKSYAWRRADLYDFARDPVAAVRLAAVQHPQAADELLTDALADEHPEVATAARSALKARRAAPRAAPETARRLSSAPIAPSPSSAPRRESASPGLFNQLKSIFWK